MNTENNQLSSSDIKLLAEVLDTRAFRAGEVCNVNQNEQGLSNDCLLITKGIVKGEFFHPELTGKIEYEKRMPGSFIGEWYLARKEPVNCQFIAETDCEVLCLSNNKLEELSEQYPALAYRLYRALAFQTAGSLHTAQSASYNSLFDKSTDLRVEETISNAKKAQQQIILWDDESIDKLIVDIAANFRGQLDHLAQWEIQETKIGNAIDKRHKLNLVVENVLKDLLEAKTQGKIRQVNSHVIEYASPVGVIFGVIPLTNPISNSLFKALLAIKTRNALIVSYPRVAINLGIYTIELIQKILRKHGLSPYLIQHVPLPSSKMLVKLFMSHRDIDLILATGGPDLVKAAYSSGNPAYGVGPGNVPVIISQTADVEQAANDVIKGKSYDNGIVCGSESNLIVSNIRKEAFIQALERHGAAVLNAQETVLACEKFFDPSSHRLKRELIGLSGQELANKISLSRPYTIKLLIIPMNLQNMLWLGKEKMAPILSMYATDDKELLPLAKKLLMEGCGHTAVIHSQNLEEIDQYAQEIPAGRLLVNTPATHGMLGESTAIATSFMLGSGTYGGNITTDEIIWRHFVNLKRLAFDIEKPLPIR